jgi:hypothetical protein
MASLGRRKWTNYTGASPGGHLHSAELNPARSLDQVVFEEEIPMFVLGWNPLPVL